MIKTEVESRVKGRKADGPERYFWPNLDEERKNVKERIENCPLRNNHGKGEGYEEQVDFERIEGMQGINKGLEKRYYVCLECRFLYATN